MVDLSHLGNRIKENRRAQGLSIKDLAERSGISIGTISTIERGIQNNPRVQTVAAIGNVLGLTVDEMIRNGSE